jgi:hypothetical protein
MTFAPARLPCFHSFDERSLLIWLRLQRKRHGVQEACPCCHASVEMNEVKSDAIMCERIAAQVKYFSREITRLEEQHELVLTPSSETEHRGGCRV